MSDDKVRQLIEVIRRQNVGLEALIVERDKLRTELDAFVAWAGSDLDALSVLQRVYSDPTASKAEQTNAAKAAIGFELAKPASSSVVVKVDFRERVRNARLRQLELDKAQWAREAEAKPGLLGSDHEGEALEAEGDPAA
jgi:hypothetical protein